MSEKTAKSERISKDRKRELDRKAQRLARERTKNRIAHLESMVAHYQQTDLDTRSLSLMDRLSKVTSERDKLMGLLESLSFTIRSHLEGDSATNNRSCSSTTAESSSTQPQPGPDVSNTAQSFTMEQSTPHDLLPETPGEIFSGCADSQMWSIMPHDPHHHPGVHSNSNRSDNLLDESVSFQANTLLLELPPPLPESFSTADDVIVPQPVSSECECTRHTPERPSFAFSIWRKANEIMRDLVTSPIIGLPMEGQQSEDAIIRAVMYGWNRVEETGPVPIVCQKLRKLDEIAPIQGSPIDRLAILSLMHLMIVNHNNDRQAHLPRWLHARPSQKLPHSIAIDFVFWPGVRERLVFSQHKYCTNAFWRAAFSNTRIAWPFDFRDTYVRNSATGKLYLSPYFRQCIQDMNNWAMTHAFMEQYPELRDDIEGYASPPRF
ncbi:hypothetical protein B0J12DRAFT_743302 [Macrophomina phaseolina]|uniref:BZIP transcription factor n=1 Tax=Macrophomina phaseolina TaxID=35725 RepID=A0ABQ8G4Q7_9PEZI|nr:hypothetical protein B0J12DRAFT_743302 [Macrophomina phaseolina]